MDGYVRLSQGDAGGPIHCYMYFRYNEKSSLIGIGYLGNSDELVRILSSYLSPTDTNKLTIRASREDKNLSPLNNKDLVYIIQKILEQNSNTKIN